MALRIANLTQLVQEVVADGNFEAEVSGKSVRLEAQSDIVIEKADQYALRSACENIIRNAIRFTPPGTAVEVLLNNDQDSSFPQAFLSVRDNGPGIPESLRTQLFQPFFSTKGDLGNGLGLYISKEIVERHGGRIEVDSTPEKGTNMTVWLPRMDMAATAFQA